MLDLEENRFLARLGFEPLQILSAAVAAGEWVKAVNGGELRLVFTPIVRIHVHRRFRGNVF